MMKAKLTALTACIVLSACKTLTPNSFNVGEVDYDKLNGLNDVDRPAIAGARVFSKNGSACYKTAGGDESGVAIAVSAAGFLIKEGVAYGKSQLEKRAAYLNSDIVISGSTFVQDIPRKDPTGKEVTAKAWPAIEVANRYEIDKADKVAKAEQKAQSALKKNATKDEIREARKNAADSAAKSYDLTNASPEFKTGEDDLCVLIVAGEYQEGATGLEAWNRFAKKNDLTEVSNVTELETAGEYSGYSLSVPGSKDKKPFQDLKKDPSFIAELHIIPTSVKGGVMYTIKPTYIFYPYPLHKGTANGLERKLTIEVGLGEGKPTMLFEHIVSGKQYRTRDILSSWVAYKTDGAKQYQEVSVKVSEGPDSMPTAKIMTDLAAKDAAIEKYLIDKLEAKAKKEGWVDAEETK
ncbi:hypothetical protein ACYZUC_27655 [Pseudomonas sp. GT1P32]